jgi:hypothetical protein
VTAISRRRSRGWPATGEASLNARFNAAARAVTISSYVAGSNKAASLLSVNNAVRWALAGRRAREAIGKGSASCDTKQKTTKSLSAPWREYVSGAADSAALEALHLLGPPSVVGWALEAAPQFGAHPSISIREVAGYAGWG